MKTVSVDKGVAFGKGELTFIAGPCVIESRAMALDLAAKLSAISTSEAEASFWKKIAVPSLKLSVYFVAM